MRRFSICLCQLDLDLLREIASMMRFMNRSEFRMRPQIDVEVMMRSSEFLEACEISNCGPTNHGGPSLIWTTGSSRPLFTSINTLSWLRISLHRVDILPASIIGPLEMLQPWSDHHHNSRMSALLASSRPPHVYRHQPPLLAERCTKRVTAS